MPSVLSFANAFPMDNVLARAFNGTSDYIGIGSFAQASLQPAVPITLVGWVLLNASSNSQLFGNINSGTGGYSIQTTGGTNQGYYNAGGTAYTGSVVFSNGVWYHLAIVISSTIQGYVNGVADGSGVSFGGNFFYNFGGVNTQLSLGARVYGSTVDLLQSCSIVDFALYNIALTPTQIASLAAGTRASTIAAANQLVVLPITGASPEPDRSGNGNNGVLKGSVLPFAPLSLGGPATLGLI